MNIDGRRRSEGLFQRLGRRARWMIALVSLAVICVAVVLYLRSDHFALRRVAVAGNAVVGDEEIRAALPLEENLFALEVEELEERLERNPFIQRARVEKEYPDKLVVQLSERTPVLWLGGGELQLLAGDGTVLPRTLLDAGGFDLPVYVPEEELPRLGELERHSDEDLLVACALCDEMQCLALPLADELLELTPVDGGLRGRIADGGDIYLPRKTEDALLAALQAVWSRERLTGYSALDARYEGQIVARGGDQAPPPPPRPTPGEELLVIAEPAAEL